MVLSSQARHAFMLSCARVSSLRITCHSIRRFPGVQFHFFQPKYVPEFMLMAEDMTCCVFVVFAAHLSDCL